MAHSRAPSISKMLRASSRIGDEALVGGVVQDNGVVLSGVLHPGLELLAGVGGAGGVVGAADIDDVSLHAVVGHPEEAVLLTGAAVDDLAAIGHVVVHIGGVDGVRHQDGVVHVEQAQHIGQVALGTVGDEDLVLSQLGAAACVVALNGLLQERVALLGAVAVEAFLGAHLSVRRHAWRAPRTWPAAGSHRRCPDG